MKNKTDRRKFNAQKLFVATSDIRAATNACQFLIENVKDKNHPLYVPLLTAIIVSYARPFSESRKRGYGELKGKWRKFPNRELQDMHETLLDMRNKVIAHSDSDARKVEIQIEDTQLGKRISSVSVVSQSLPLEVFPAVLRVCRDLGDRLELEALNELDCLSDDGH
jgi:hypothetical protein